jgi:hypothetical protein
VEDDECMSFSIETDNDLKSLMKSELPEKPTTSERIEKLPETEKLPEKTTTSERIEKLPKTEKLPENPTISEQIKSENQVQQEIWTSIGTDVRFEHKVQVYRGNEAQKFR